MFLAFIFKIFLCPFIKNDELSIDETLQVCNIGLMQTNKMQM